MSGIPVRAVPGTDEDLEFVAPLWRAMVEHHRQVAGDAVQLYRRVGFRPWLLELAAPLDDSPGGVVRVTGVR